MVALYIAGILGFIVSWIVLQRNKMNILTLLLSITSIEMQKEFKFAGNFLRQLSIGEEDIEISEEFNEVERRDSEQQIQKREERKHFRSFTFSVYQIVRILLTAVILGIGLGLYQEIQFSITQSWLNNFQSFVAEFKATAMAMPYIGSSYFHSLYFFVIRVFRKCFREKTDSQIKLANDNYLLAKSLIQNLEKVLLH